MRVNFRPSMDVMALGLRNFVVALSALLFGIGNAACACLPDSSFIPASDSTSVAGHSYGAVHGGAGEASHHLAGDAGNAETDGAPCGPTNNDCQHCQLAQFAAAPDAAKLQTPSLATGPFVAILAQAVTPVTQRTVAETATRLKWAAPPGPTPVSLKIRLLI